MDTEAEHTPYTLADILAGIRAAVETVRHHEKPSRLKAAIEKALPRASVYYDPKPYGNEHMGRVSVWGGEVDYNHMITCYLRQDNLPWPDAVLWYAKRADDSDYRERATAEVGLWAEFSAMESQIRELQERARDMVKALPIPQAAIANGLRDKDFYWHRPTLEAQTKFPYLFAEVKA